MLVLSLFIGRCFTLIVDVFISKADPGRRHSQWACWEQLSEKYLIRIYCSVFDLATLTKLRYVWNIFIATSLKQTYCWNKTKIYENWKKSTFIHVAVKCQWKLMEGNVMQTLPSPQCASFENRDEIGLLHGAYPVGVPTSLLSVGLLSSSFFCFSLFISFHCLICFCILSW